MNRISPNVKNMEHAEDSIWGEEREPGGQVAYKQAARADVRGLS